MDFNDIFAKSEEKVGKCVKQEEEKKEEKDAIKYAVFSFPFLKEKIAVVYVKAYWKEAKERFPQLVLFTRITKKGLFHQERVWRLYYTQDIDGVYCIMKVICFQCKTLIMVIPNVLGKAVSKILCSCCYKSIKKRTAL